MSVSHLRPLLGGVESSSTTGLFTSINGETEPRPSVSGNHATLVVSETVLVDDALILKQQKTMTKTILSLLQSVRSGETRSICSEGQNTTGASVDGGSNKWLVDFIELFAFCCVCCRYTWVTGKEPLTYYDMNLSAQDHQTFFTGDTPQLRPEDAGEL